MSDRDLDEGRAPAAARREWRPWIVARNVLLAILAVIFLIWLVLFVTHGRFLKRPFERTASWATGRTVTVGGSFELYFAPIKLKFVAEKLGVSNPAWASKPSLFSADRIDALAAPLSLVFGTRHFYALDLVNGAMDLEWDAAHSRNTWTFSDTKKSGKPLAWPRIEHATIAGTTIRYADPQMQLLADIGVDTITAINTRIGKAVGMHGAGQVRGTPFRLEAKLLSPDATAAGGRTDLTLRAWAANSIIDVAGSLPSLGDIEGVPLQTRVQGHNLADLFHVIDVTLPSTRTYDLRATTVKNDQVYSFTGIKGIVGGTDLAGTLKVTNGARLRLDATLATRQLDIIDAAPFMGYNPDIVARKGAVAAAAATGAAPQRIIPDAELPIAAMRRFDAGLRWTIGVVKSKNVPVSNILLVLSLDDGKLAMSPLNFSMSRGDVATDIVIDTRQRPSADSYDIRLAPTPMGRLLKGYGVDESGTSGTIHGRIKLAGRGDSIHDSLATASGRIAVIMPSGTFWTRNVQLAELDIGTFVTKMFQHKLKEPARINCGIIAFTVRDGIAATDPILIDTSKNVITGRGGFSFRDEALDLAIRADAKKFSLFSLQSPVGVGGHFGSPGIRVISPQLLTRAGAGVGLGVVASPLAAVLAFVDIGDAKAAACGPVLAGAGAAAQRTAKGAPRKDVGDGKTAKPEAKHKKVLGVF